METIIEQAVADKAFPGAVWRVYKNDGLLYEEAAGTLAYDSLEPVTFQTKYDLASVTKPFISFAILLLVDRGLLALETPASHYLSELRTHEKKIITISQLLLHTAGLVSNPELHKTFTSRELLYNEIFAHPLVLQPNQKVAYTSIGYQYLGYIIEHVTNMELSEFLQKELFEPLDMKSITYLPKSNIGIAPTEYSVFRQRYLKGEVHDDNCFLLGGVGGHAGLFATVEDVCTFGRMQLNPKMSLLSSRGFQGLFSDQTVGMNIGRSFAFVVNDPIFGDWGVDTFAHTGFTGTSIFIVPELNVVSVLLTNRVHPTRDNQKINGYRQILHTWLEKWMKE